MAKPSRSQNPFHLLAEAWTFFWKQPALLSVLIWFLIFPVALADILMANWPQSSIESTQQIGSMGFGLMMLIMVVVTFWGLACVLLVGRRLVLSKSGRARTSFRSVRRESVKYIVPLFFTSLLRSIITIEWSLIAIVPGVLYVLTAQQCRATFSPLLSRLGTFFDSGSVGSLFPIFQPFLHSCWPLFFSSIFLIPAVVYQIRSAFFGIVIVADNLRYRDALRQSRIMIRGHFWKTVWVLAVLFIVTFAPAQIVAFAVEFVQGIAAPQLSIISIVFDDAMGAIASLFFLLSLIAYYGKLRKNAGRVEEVVPEVE